MREPKKFLEIYYLRINTDESNKKIINKRF